MADCFGATEHPVVTNAPAALRPTTQGKEPAMARQKIHCLFQDVAKPPPDSPSRGHSRSGRNRSCESPSTKPAPGRFPCGRRTRHIGHSGGGGPSGCCFHGFSWSSPSQALQKVPSCLHSPPQRSLTESADRPTLAILRRTIMGDSEGTPRPERSPDLPSTESEGSEAGAPSSATVPEAEPAAAAAAAPRPPGHIPEPQERPWDDEPADPFEGIDRSNPFEGRPASAGLPPEEQPAMAPPGQPLPELPSGTGEGHGDEQE
jgi:hypothetical protein